MKNKLNKSTLLALLSGVFAGSLVLSNILAGRVFDLGFWGLTLTAGVFIFPVTFIVNDILAEVYGFKKVSMIIWLGFAMNLIAVCLYWLANALPAPDYMISTAEAYQTILGTSFRALVASLAAYLVGGFVNAKVMDYMHKKHGETKFKHRAILSTIFGESADSILFVTIMFLGVLPLGVMLSMIIIQASAKTLFEIIFLPLTTRLVAKAKELK